jgi:hypothetical protein
MNLDPSKHQSYEPDYRSLILFGIVRLIINGFWRSMQIWAVHRQAFEKG